MSIYNDILKVRDYAHRFYLMPMQSELEVFNVLRKYLYMYCNIDFVSSKIHNKLLPKMSYTSTWFRCAYDLNQPRNSIGARMAALDSIIKVFSP